MKRISIRARVTLWYTGLLVVLLGLGVVYLLSFSDQMLLRQTRDALLDVVSDAVKPVSYTHLSARIFFKKPGACM